jgi:FMN-dependent oxidoreductase (nitrilotriacetate monooxygenase family)
MPKKIHFNAFSMNSVGHLSPGLWTHPRDRTTHYKDLRYWTDLAKTCERGLFDAMFLADVIGTYDVFRGDPKAAVREAVQTPVNDPLQLVPAMATVTEHLGFGITAAITSEAPFPFARRMATLDHLTQGRAAWNIVTSFLDSAARNIGRTRQISHDERYDIADEYLDVCYKLWEGAWEDGSVLADKASGVYADPDKIHRVIHTGQHFQVDGIFLSEPSPQRTPILFQAGASGRGRRFAARHAECIFTGAPTRTVLKKQVAALHEEARLQGRAPADFKIYNLYTVVLGRTDAEAKEKLAEYRAHVSLDGALTLLSGWTGIDFSAFDPDEPLRHVYTDANQSAVEAFTSSDPSRVWTIRELAEWVGIGGRGPLAVGSPSTVAVELLGWMEETQIDGFNLSCVVMPETFEDVVNLLVPELQNRGAYPTEYAPGTLRQKLFGHGAHLPASHAGAGFRTAARANPTIIAAE